MDVYKFTVETSLILPHQHRPLATAGLYIAKIILILLCSLPLAIAAEDGEAKLLFVKSGAASVYNSVINAAKQRINQICEVFELSPANNSPLRVIPPPMAVTVMSRFVRLLPMPTAAVN